MGFKGFPMRRAQIIRVKQLRAEPASRRSDAPGTDNSVGSAEFEFEI